MRLAYAKTYGRPNFSDIIPTATISEEDLDADEIDDPDVIKGNINIRNTNLKPWTADNYDLSIEHYTPQGGIFSAGVFRKDIDDFFGTGVRVATLADLEEVGLDSKYLGWNLNTKFNSGSARISGLELSARHSLRQLAGWGRFFTVFANMTHLKLEGNPHAAFTSFVPKSANWGFSFNWKRVTIVPKWNYRGLNKLTARPQAGADGFNYLGSRLIMDVNFSYRLNRRLSLTGSIGNLLDDKRRELRYGSETPSNARLYLDREYGVAFSFGIKGTY